MMNVKRVKRKCGVRGCRNTDSFSICRTNEAGNSIIICRSCLSDALSAVDGYKTRKKPPTAAPPPLFFNAAVKPQRTRARADAQEEKPEVTEE